VTLAFVSAGALGAWPGKVGLILTLGSWSALAYAYWRGQDSSVVVEQALREGLGGDYREHVSSDVAAQFTPIDWKQIAFPFPIRHPDVERIRDITFRRVGGLNLKLDVYRNRRRPVRCPTILQVHGGAWVVGSKNEQGLPLMHHLAARGWTCISANYRLSPHATFPEHLIDLKRAIGWVREHAESYGADPDFLVVTGGSAGGHLASLLALTPNDPRYQPGFEHLDTSVQACVSFYGVYDFTNRYGTWHHEALADLLENQIMKASVEEDRDRYEQASPMSRIHSEAPPFFIVHGELDTLVPIEEARRFASDLRDRSKEPVAFAEIPGAQHAFELFPSLRSVYVVHGVERFLAHCYSRYLAATGAAEPSRQAV